MLAHHPNKPEVSRLLTYLQYGHPLHYPGPRTNRSAPNLKSVRASPKLALQKIFKEIRLGRIAGPFDSPSATGLPFLTISPIGLIPKNSGGFRMIHHLSYPWGRGINAFIPEAEATVQYAKFDHAISYIERAGPHAWLAKVDVKSAYRLLPIRPQDFPLLGIQVKRGKSCGLMGRRR